MSLSVAGNVEGGGVSPEDSPRAGAWETKLICAVGACDSHAPFSAIGLGG